jgi:hypothetical protein
MSKGRTAALLLALAAASAGALDWPVDQAALLGTFGASDEGSFECGIELAGAGQPVWPVAAGDVVFRYREGDYSSLPRGSGNMVALIHEGAILSVYSHLRETPAEPKSFRARPRQLSRDELEEAARAAGDPAAAAVVRSAFDLRGERYALRSDVPAAALVTVWGAVARVPAFAPLGIVGDSGAVEGPRLALMLLDAREKRFLNPIKPDKPPLQPAPQASGRPVIEQVLLERDGRRFPVTDGMIVPAGSAQALVVAYDSVTRDRFAQRVAPYRLSLALSGQIVNEIKFEGLMEADGRLVVAGGRSRYEDVYADRWTYRLGRVTLPEGQAHLQVRVEGLGGASRTVDLLVQVRP